MSHFLIFSENDDHNDGQVNLTTSPIGAPGQSLPHVTGGLLLPPVQRQERCQIIIIIRAKTLGIPNSLSVAKKTQTNTIVLSCTSSY